MNLPKNLSLTQPTKRFLSFAIDFAIAALVGFVLFAFWGSRGLFESLGGEALWQEAMEFYGTSHVYDVPKNEDGTWAKQQGSLLMYNVQPSSDQEHPGYYYYLEATYLFYTDFLPNNSHIDSVNGVAAKDYYTVSYFNTSIMGLPSDLTKIDVTDETTYKSENGYFKYALNNDGTAVDVTKMPVVTSDIDSQIKGGKVDWMNKVYKFFLSNENKVASGVYYEAALLLSNQSYLKPLGEAYSHVNWVTNAVCYSIPLVLFFLIIPFATPNGESIGKLVMKTGIAKKNGTKIGPLQRFVRPWVVALFLSPFVFIPKANQMMALLIMIFLLFIDFTFALRDKTGAYRTLQDRLCGTLNYDKKTSKVFATDQEAEQYVIDHNVVETATNETIKVVDSETILMDESIIDLDTLSRRDEAISSYDSFEERKED